MKRLLLIVDAISRELLPDFDKPFAFFGHSMGAMLSFELARQLRRQYGIKPERLFVSGCSAPHLFGLNEPRYNLSEPAFLAAVRQLNGMPKEVSANEELMQIILPRLRADFEVCETYHYTSEPPLECPIIAFGGLYDREVARECLQEWQKHTIASFTLHMLPGDHFFLASCEKALTEIIDRELFQVVENLAK